MFATSVNCDCIIAGHICKVWGTRVAFYFSDGSSHHIWDINRSLAADKILSRSWAVFNSIDTLTHLPPSKGVMAFLNYFKASKADPAVQTDVEISDTSSGPEVIHDGNLAYTRAKAGNGSKAAYQEAVGAPVETDSPLGYEVGWFTVIFVNINMLIGTGIFSLRKFERIIDPLFDELCI